MKPLFIFLAVFLVFLTACNTSQITDTTERNYTFGEDKNNSGRPIFNRTELPEEDDDSEVVNSSENPQNNQSVFITTNEQMVTFSVPIGWSLGKLYPVITKDEVPLLRPAAIQTGDNRFRGYRQNIILSNKTGNVTFIVDDDRNPEYIGTVLKYEEEEKFLAYELLLNSKPFFDPAVIGSDILLLGREYRVMEATDFTLLLNGINIEQYARVSEGDRFETNDKLISDSEVTYNGFAFKYWLKAPDVDDDSMQLRPLETLRERLAEDYQSEALFGVFDMRYEGIEPFVGNTILFDVDSDEIEMEVNGVSIPILARNEEGNLQHGFERTVHFVECENRRDGCIKDDDAFVLQGMQEGKLVTRLLRVAGIDEDERQIIFRDVETTERVSVDYAGRQAEATLPFLDRNYRIYAINSTRELENGSLVNVTDSLAIDLDGDGRVSGKNVPLSFKGLEITIDEIPENTTQGVFNITLESGYKSSAQRRDNNGMINKEEIVVQFAYDDEFFVRMPTRDALWNQELIVDSEDEYAHGLSPWGTRAWLEYTGDVQETTDELLLEIPYEQRFARVSMGALE